MDWLQTLDAELFRFINLRLINPVCDVVMPFASGNALFRPLLLLAGLLLIWKGRARGILCLLMLALILPLGDGLICNTIKHAVGRPRPFVVRSSVKGQRRLCQHALFARCQLVRGDDDSLYLLPPQPVVHAAGCDPGQLLAHLQRRPLPKRCVGGRYPGRGLCRGLGLVNQRALAVGRAALVPALVAELPVAAGPGLAG